LSRVGRGALAALLLVVGLVAPPVRQAAAQVEAQAAVGTATYPLVSLDQQVTALGNSQFLVPPDVSFAVSTDRIVEAVNSSYSIWDKATGTKLAGPTSLATLLVPPAGYRISDPRVMFDAASSRWFLSAMSFRSTTMAGAGGRLHLAVSATSNPAGAWNNYVVASDSSAASVLFDQPRLGVTDDKVVIAWDSFNTLPTESFTGAQYVTLDKAQAMAGTQPASVLSTASATRFAIVPAQNQAAGADAYLVYNRNVSVGSASIGIIKVSGSPSLATVTETETQRTIRVTSPPPAATQNGPETIDSSDDRFLNAVWMANKLWVGGSTLCRPAGDTADRSCGRLIQVSTAGTPTVAQDFDVSQSGNHVFYPAVTFNGLGDMFVGFSMSSPSTFVRFAGAGQLASDANKVSTITVLKPGEAAYDQAAPACGFSSTGASRWGDYGFGALDPSDTKSGWVGGEYAKLAPGATAAGCDWGTVASRMSFPAPTITTVTPSVVPANEAVGSITIDGSDFSADSQVLFDGVAGGTVTVVSSNRITVVPPQNHGPGDVAVTVTTGYGTSGAATLRYVARPVVTSVSPTEGATDGGASVVITGSNFTGATAVRFGGVNASFVVNGAGTQITTTAPAHAAGQVDVVVSNQGIDSATSANTKFTYVARPVVTLLTPRAGPVEGGTTVTINGSGFTGATAVRFGGVDAASFTVNGAGTQITATAPAHAAGVVDVVVTSQGFDSAITAADRFTYVNRPMVSGLSPARGPDEGGTTVTITGSNFTGATTVTFGGVGAGFSVDSDTQITAVSPAHAGAVVDVVVAKQGVASTTSSASTFTYVARPVVTGVSPSVGPTEGGTTITVTGTKFSGTTAVQVGGVAATSFTVNSDTSLTVVTPAHAAGQVDVVVSNQEFDSAVNGGSKFTYVTRAVVSSLSPSSGPPEGGTTVVITGSNFTGATAVRFGGADAASFTIDSDTSITAVSPARAASTVAVQVSKQGIDSATGPGSMFTYATPPPPTTTTTTAPPPTTTTTTAPPPTTTTAPPPPPAPKPQGYRMVASDGGIFTFGAATFHGSTGNLRLNSPIVGMASTPSGSGYWLVAADGGMFAFGDAGFFGSTGNLRLNSPIVGMASTPSGNGYWLVAADGGIFTFGDAGFFGSAGNIRLNKPIVGMASSPTGQGYWFVASDGGIFAFGDAPFLGSTGNIRLNKPIVGMAASPSGQGYWFVAADGGIFAFGDAPFLGSTGDIRLNLPIVGMTSTATGRGYRLVASDGGIFTFGDAEFLGSTGDIKLNKPIVGIA
jgi:hypothetical protein